MLVRRAEAEGIGRFERVLAAKGGDPVTAAPIGLARLIIRIAKRLETLGPVMRDVADEIVVADMASTDATRALAEAQGARIIDMPLAPIVEPVLLLRRSSTRPVALKTIGEPG